MLPVWLQCYIYILIEKLSFEIFKPDCDKIAPLGPDTAQMDSENGKIKTMFKWNKSLSYCRHDGEDEEHNG